MNIISTLGLCFPIYFLMEMIDLGGVVQNVYQLSPLLGFNWMERRTDLKKITLRVRGFPFSVKLTLDRYHHVRFLPKCITSYFLRTPDLS